jgi:hypothetical protein
VIATPPTWGGAPVDDLPIVEYLTFMAIMEEADIQLYI